MKLQSCQKSIQSKNLKIQGHKIKFEYDQERYSCFISKKGPLKSKKIQEPPPIHQNLRESTHTNDKQIKQPLSRLRASSFVLTNYKSFNYKLLLMRYDKNDVYVDSTRAQGRSKSKTPSPKHQEQDSQQYDFYTPCVRIITEETNHTSNPLSARYTPQDLTPDTQEIYSMNYSNQSYFQNSVSCRNKRAISFEESRAYIIDARYIETDGRSTIMIRNIPNKYTQQMLLKLFESYRKKFDFFYLPIDYKNNCNVGYAFLNFIHTKFIHQFYLEFHNKKWQKFNSEKICQICYARIQGTVQLAYHFQNSKVIHQKDKRVRPLGFNQTMYSNLSTLIQRQKQQI